MAAQVDGPVPPGPDGWHGEHNLPCCLETGFLMSGDEGARLADPGLGLSWFGVNLIPVMPGMNPTWFVHAPVQRYHSVSSCIAQRNSA